MIRVSVQSETSYGRQHNVLGLRNKRLTSGAASGLLVFGQEGAVVINETLLKFAVTSEYQSLSCACLMLMSLTEPRDGVKQHLWMLYIISNTEYVRAQ